MNRNFHRSRRIKDDEYYTKLDDISKEVCHYDEHFRDKVVYSNCDTIDSNFVRYFQTRRDLSGYIYSFDDFRSQRNIENLKYADIICTNPPFSLFREYVELLMRMDKKFLILGNFGALVYKEIFPLFQENKIWYGYGKRGHKFTRRDGTDKKVNSAWFTNLPHGRRNDRLVLVDKYNEEKYPKYDNYDAIHVAETKAIPMDYMGCMGVPTTFMDKYNPEQFEIVGLSRYLPKRGKGKEFTLYDGKKMPYQRIVIRQKEGNET